MPKNANEHVADPAKMTAAAVEPGDTAQILPEFGRVGDVERIFGLKRGIVYQLIGEGKLKSVCLRKPGAKTGVRLVHLASVRAFLHTQMS